MSGLLFLYGFIALLVFGTAALAANSAGYTTDRRAFARAAFLSPVWPLLLAWQIGVWLVWLWRAADFGRHP